MMIASPSKHYTGHHKVTEKEGNSAIPGKDIWTKKCRQCACMKMETTAQDRAG